MNNMIRYTLLILMFAGLAFSQNDIPDRPESWVTDKAGILTDQQRNYLDKVLSDVQKRSSNQIFVAIFTKMPDGYYLEGFVNKLYDKWRPGLKDKDNGIIMAIFIQDRKIRIEVGYGLEDVITDAQSGAVIRDQITPQFKKGKYYEGILNALQVLIPAAEGKYEIPVKESRKKDNGDMRWIIYGIIILITLSRFFGGGGKGMGTKKRSGGVYPIFFGGSGGGFGGGSSGGGFGGGFGGMSGGGGASGGW